MRVFAACLLIAAAPAAAEPFSIAGAGLSPDEVHEVLEADPGRYVAVGDRLVDVASSTAAGQDVALSREQGEALVRGRLNARLQRLRQAAREGRLTEQDRAEARALSVVRSTLLSWRDSYFLDSLSPAPEDDPLGADPVDTKPLRVPPPGTTAGQPDAIAAELRARLKLDDHGDPAQAEALDMAIRLMLQSPTARELSAEFAKLNLHASVSFDKLDGGVVDTVGKHKYVSGVGGLTSHSDGEHVSINSGYLETDPRYQFSNVPGTLAHELLGHVLNEAKAQNAQVVPAMNVWRGDEDLAGVTGWLVQAEIDGKAPSDSYLWAYLADPEGYVRRRHLITRYYAETFSPDEAARADEVFAERLARVDRRIGFLRARLDEATDWGKVLDHFEKVHGVASARLTGLRLDLVDSSSTSARVELSRLLEIKTALTKDLADLKDPVNRSRQADLAKQLKDPFFGDTERRLATLTDRLRAIASKNPPFQTFPPDPAALGWSDLERMYADDRRDHPEHWDANVTVVAGESYTAGAR